MTKKEKTDLEVYNPFVQEYKNDSSIDVLHDLPENWQEKYQSCEYRVDVKTGYYGYILTRKSKNENDQERTNSN